MSHPSVRDLLAAAVARLRGAGVPDPARDARRLIAAVLNTTVPGPSDPVHPEAAARFDAMIARRAAREPVSHILGYRAFWGRNFVVGPDVLDPRPETETLVEAALAAPFERVLDLGTGSGAILLTLLDERPAATGLGTDISQAALNIATRNAEALGVARRAGLRVADWFTGVDGVYDLIVSNPPYIAQDEMERLERELSYEPQGALTDGADGLSAYRAIATGASGHLAPGGRILVEIGPSQGQQVMAIFREAGLVDVSTMRDLDGRDRVVGARMA